MVVTSADLSSARQMHLISSTAHRSDGVHARVVANTAPSPNALPLEPTLEDAYLAALTAQRNSASSGAAA
jgi:ABC-2 type transport system ATP-binding protein